MQNQICQIELFIQVQTLLAEPYLWTHHKVGVWLHMAGPDPGILLANGTQTHAILSVERRLLIRAGQDNVLALGKVADATRIKGEEFILSNLRKKQWNMDNAKKQSFRSSGLPHVTIHHLDYDQS